MIRRLLRKLRDRQLRKAEDHLAEVVTARCPPEAEYSLEYEAIDHVVLENLETWLEERHQCR